MSNQQPTETPTSPPTSTLTTNTTDATTENAADLLKTTYPSIADPAIPIIPDKPILYDWLETRFADTYMDSLDKGYALFRRYAPGKARPVAVCGTELIEVMRVEIAVADERVKERRKAGELFGSR